MKNIFPRLFRDERISDKKYPFAQEKGIQMDRKYSSCRISKD
jgi:hypothetical protein